MAEDLAVQYNCELNMFDKIYNEESLDAQLYMDIVNLTKNKYILCIHMRSMEQMS